MRAAIDEPRVVLLIVRARKQLFPMSTAALVVGQGSQAWFDGEYLGALILDQDGCVSRIECVEVVGLFGDSAPRKLLSLLSRVKKIRVTLAPAEITLSELKAEILDCIMNGGYWDEEIDDDERHRIVRAVEMAPNASALFGVFEFGTPDDALDGL